MAAQFHPIFPVLESIGKRPFLRKWIDIKSHNGEVDAKKYQRYIDDVYQFLLKTLEKENLELAYKFRFTVEEVGPEAFVSRQYKLDRALRKAKNRSYEPLEKLLDEVQLESEVDYDHLFSEYRISRPQTKEQLALEAAFEESILPIIQEISNPEIRLPNKIASIEQTDSNAPQNLPLMKDQLNNFFEGSLEHVSEIDEKQSQKTDGLKSLTFSDHHNDNDLQDNDSSVTFDFEPSDAGNFDFSKEIESKQPESKTKQGVASQPQGNILLKGFSAQHKTSNQSEQKKEAKPTYLPLDATGRKTPLDASIPDGQVPDQPDYRQINYNVEKTFPDFKPQKHPDEFFDQHSELSDGTEIPINSALASFPTKSKKSSESERIPEISLKTNEQKREIPKKKSTPALNERNEELAATDETETSNKKTQQIHKQLVSVKLTKETADFVQTELEPQQVEPLKYSMAGFGAPISVQKTGDDNKNKNQKETEQEEEKKETSKVALKDFVKDLPGVNNQTNLFRVKKEDKLNGSEIAKSCEKRLSKAFPPPLYKFKFKLKQPTGDRFAPIHDAGVSLVVSSDSIDRRMNSSEKKTNFFEGSSVWSQFKKNNAQSFFQDSTSLIIQRDCIESRIEKISTPERHALNTDSASMAAFRAFDGVFNTGEEPINIDEETFELDDEVEVSHQEHLTDLYAEEIYADEANKKLRKKLFNSSLKRLNNRDGTLFDYLSGKISIDSSDKLEVEKWIRSQQSGATEIYRTYAEAVIQIKQENIHSIQSFVNGRLRRSDFPSQRVRAIFDKLAKKSENLRLKRHDLVTMLKRQNYVSYEVGKRDSSISFADAYSKYRVWRYTVESPKIHVRQVDTRAQKPTIPTKGFERKWNFLDSPQINVRTNGDSKNSSLTLSNRYSYWKQTLSN